MADPDYSWLLETGEALLGPASAALSALYPEDPEIDSFVALGTPVAQLSCDRLNIYLQTLGPDADSTRRAAALSGCATRFFPTLAGSWEIQLWRTCYPGLTTVGDQIQEPKLADLVEVNDRMYREGAAIYCATVDGVAEGFAGMPNQIDKVTIGNLRPLGPQGTAMGWAIPLTTYTR